MSNKASHPPEASFVWSASQRRVILCLLAGVFLLLSIRLLRNPRPIADPQPPVADRASELQDRLDPNTAPVEMLSALPMIGPKRAAAIAAYRESWQRMHPGQAAFANPNDLMRVDGLGPVTVQQLAPHLHFLTPDSAALNPQDPHKP